REGHDVEPPLAQQQRLVEAQLLVTDQREQAGGNGDGNGPDADMRFGKLHAFKEMTLGGSGLKLRELTQAEKGEAVNRDEHIAEDFIAGIGNHRRCEKIRPAMRLQMA